MNFLSKEKFPVWQFFLPSYLIKYFRHRSITDTAKDFELLFNTNDDFS